MCFCEHCPYRHFWLQVRIAFWRAFQIFQVSPSRLPATEAFIFSSEVLKIFILKLMGESNHIQTPLHCLSLSDDRVVLRRVSLLLLCQRVLIFLQIFFLLLLHILIYTFPYCLRLSEDAWWSTLLMTYPAPIPPISFFLSEPCIHPGSHLLPCTYLGTSWEGDPSPGLDLFGPHNPIPFASDWFKLGLLLTMTYKGKDADLRNLFLAP